MERVIEHLKAALAILEPVRFDAQNRFEQYDKRRRTHSSAARQVWSEYRDSGEAISHINDAILFVDALKAKK